MSNIRIKVENLSKLYKVGEFGTGTISHDLNRWWQTNVLKREDPYKRIGSINDRTLKANKNEYVYAIKDITFEIEEGAIVGIIGKNGAGKSTLLKILSRITSPSKGEVNIKGRVASLLEVGTGFHPEMTGRENIYLNGTIMGMTRNEISSKLEEIVEFAGVAKYLDTPVKRYSSGMTVRLGFAIAAHLEPEILVVDEVLAVGDMEFQKKAIGKMQDVSTKDGRTVLFVSHNMQAISTLTNSCVVLDKGEIVFNGDTNAAIKRYYESDNSNDLIYSDFPSENIPKVTKVEVITSEKNNIHVQGKELTINFEVTSPIEIPSTVFSFQIINSNQVKVQHVLIKDSETPLCRGIGIHKFSCTFPKSSLYPDKYTLKLHLSDHITRQKYQTIESVCPFEVQVRGEVREYYWKPNEAVYVEESIWKTY